MILPGASELTAAGAPQGVLAMGQALPLFACMEMSRENAQTGKPELPLFMSHADCTDAVDQAMSMDGNEGPSLEIVGLSLPSVVDRLVTVSEETPAFMFIPPSASTKFITDYLQQ